MKFFALLCIVAVAFAEEGPACDSSERYNCAGLTVPQRDADDCSVFYNCDANIQNPCPSTCPPGLLFNDVLKICDWPAQVTGCGPEPSFFMTYDETEGSGPACAPEERYNCAGSMVPVRDADDCSVFYNCDYNIQEPCPSTCPPGLLYNDILKVCDWPSEVHGCGAEARNGNMSGMPDLNPTPEGPACAPEERYNCAGSMVPVRDADDCSVFYNCDYNIQEPCPSTCPPGLLYNDILKVCDWPSEVQGCGTESRAMESDEEVEGPACSPEERYNCAGLTVPQRDADDCSVFYNCDANIQNPCPSTCPPGLLFNDVLKICDWPAQVTGCGPEPSFFMTYDETEGSGPACAPEERYNCAGSMVPVRDADDCSVFYNCDYNIQEPCPSTCPPGLLYNDILKVCDWPSEVQCGPQARNGNMSGMPANQTPTPTPEGPACAPEERYNCAGSMVPVRDADDCSVFYNCDYNIQEPCPSTCPPGLLYNDILKVCDWPSEVQGCGAESRSMGSDDEVEGPACAPEERYNCAGQTVPQRDADDCSVFYNCDANIQNPCPSACPPGLLYNDILKICDWPTSVQC